MRAVIWFLLLFAVAVVASSTLGANDGLVTIYSGTWRFDVSLNLFILVLIGACFVLVTVIQGVDSLFGLPRRAREWRVSRRDRMAQSALRDALLQFFSGRYSRAQKSAQRALTLQEGAPELAQDREFTVLGHLLAAGSAHRLQDRAARNDALQRALDLSRSSLISRAGEDSARLLAAEWALDDRDAPRATQLLSELPLGVARRTQALRLKLQASRLGQMPQEALKTARLLAKHQAFSKGAAQGLLRSLAFEALDTARDADQLRRVWMQFDPVDRRDPFVAARAATLSSGLDAVEDARGWLRPFWDRLSELGLDERMAIALATVESIRGIGAEWLPRLEAAAQAYPREGAIAMAVGCALAQRQLWGMARRLLEQAAADPQLPPTHRRRAWVQLAELARQEGDADRATRCFESAASLA